ncbi:phosphotransferase [Micromonospora thermarum]|uniref:Phosphotransferase n=1 Tax=Micromonospora thermarum TaxID=2720024 RepID=A0ABX0ZBM4_9ACTN|nr:phosphotransferase [Micromonospora thermarum]NJP34473.1 phosphotransferase [Micromonospora thermarum]
MSRRSGPAPASGYDAPLSSGCRPLASGRDADVYALDGDRVLRRYRSGGDVAAEAAVMTHLHRLGYPVPRVHHAAGPDLVLDRLVGPTLAQSVVIGRTDAWSAARILLDLLGSLHALPTRRAAVPADRILHLDLHPENVILTPAGPVVIDWRNAREGRPGLDVAMSAVILGEVAADGGSPLCRPARELLVAYLARTGPLPLLDQAVDLRRTLGPPGDARLAAAELIRALHPTGRER